ncbi:DUF551 domain-containing protein [Cronobacter sakazakii]|nr:DUF551 domain-containing protein [Cronobacter sakazakii]PUW70064.1 DUF551 domain-containing protein [Cronobacter sakazakii]PUW72165.1 DUF551 domain-containing protein [Cronobacter sakazakii]PUW72739.1 DUF551 domain-containing protein [Cronobacter sakazakii]
MEMVEAVLLAASKLNAPPAPSIADSLPYDPQIAEYEKMIEAELKAAADMEHKPKSEMSQKAEQLLRDTTALAATLSAEADTTSQQFESLAGKAVGGWIACSERMPDFYYPCLVADEHGDMVIGLPSNLEVSDRKAFRLSNGDLFLATHWQPLPEPPCK